MSSLNLFRQWKLKYHMAWVTVTLFLKVFTPSSTILFPDCWSAGVDKNILIISQRPGQFTALGYGAVNFSYANKHHKLVLREAERNLFSKIFVFQEIEYETKKPTKNTALHPDFKLDTLYEIQITATEFLRVSEMEILSEVKNRTK